MPLLILAIDTSGKNGSLALVRFSVATDGSCGAFETLEVVPLAGTSYSEKLIPQLAAMLDRHHLAKNNIDAFAVASGPGSFTGLRVGLSSVKALADATGKPIAAVTVMEAVAWKVDATGRILVVLDAGRKQVFVGEILVDGSMRTPLSEHLLDLASFAESSLNDTAHIFTPDPQIA